MGSETAFSTSSQRVENFWGEQVDSFRLFPQRVGTVLGRLGFLLLGIERISKISEKRYDFRCFV